MTEYPSRRPALNRASRRIVQFLAVAASLAPLGAQVHAHVTQLPVAVDGAKTPGLIPDELAYRHFLMAIAERAGAPPQSIARRNALIATIGLSPGDNESLISALAGLREKLDAYYAGTEQAAADASLSAASRSAQVSSLRASQDVALDQAAASLKAALSYDGWNRLDAYVQQRVKRHIVIYASPGN